MSHRGGPVRRWKRAYRQSRRRIAERTIGCPRLTVRYDRLPATYGGFLHLAYALLVLMRVVK
jgi:hypothetical protein